MMRLRYPRKWEELYKEKWPVRIIYYDKYNNYFIYHFYLYRHIKIKNILLLFKNYLECQRLVIYNIFGLDIGSNIIKYMPPILYTRDICNNYIYVHIRKWSNHIRQRYERARVPENLSLNQTHGKISLKGYMPQQSRYTVLRIRNESLEIPNIL